jgi:dTDP-4-dehydrorhamnose reductase
MKILILGTNGQLGIELQQAFSGYGNITALGRDRCDLSQPDQLRKAVAESAPDIILNAAAYTAVDRAESEPELAMRVNREAPGVLAEEAKKRGALLVHYSTDYVFNGTKPSPWVEDDPTGPLNVYGATKLAGEQNIATAGSRYLIFRTSWVVSPHGNNFVKTMLLLGRERDHLRIVNDQTGAPTSAAAIARATRQVLEKPWEDSFAGIYHMTCAGQTTWCGFAQAIFERAKAEENKKWPAVTGIPSEEYPTPAKRPGNSALSNAKLHSRFKVQLPAWETALEETLRGLGCV